MSFQATLNLDGKEMRVLHCSFNFNRDVDATGRPSSRVRGGTIHLEVESTEDSSLFAWIAGVFDTKDGKVTFLKRDSNTKMKELYWKTGYIISYTEALDAIGENPMTIKFTISAQEVGVDDAAYLNPWPTA